MTALQVFYYSDDRKFRHNGIGNLRFHMLLDRWYICIVAVMD